LDREYAWPFAEGKVALRTNTHGRKAEGMHCLWNSVGEAISGSTPSGLSNALRAAMPDYSIVILICSTALSHSDCQPDTALDAVRGPQVNNPVMCALDAQTMLAR
jgi:hypothetical protein